MTFSMSARREVAAPTRLEMATCPFGVSSSNADFASAFELGASSCLMSPTFESCSAVFLLPGLSRRDFLLMVFSCEG